MIDGIAKFFRESSAFEYLDRANHPTECLAKMKNYISYVDIILMDVKFPKVEMDGIQLAKRIKEIYPGNIPRIAFMTISDDAIIDPENGFHGLIPKNQGIRELMEMLSDIYYKGTVYYPLKNLQEHFINKLTPRQKKIFCLVIKGNSNEIIAGLLNITINTLNSHQKIIISKIQQFGVKTDRINHPKIIELACKFKLCDHL